MRSREIAGHHDAGLTQQRRQRAGIPDTVRHRPKWEQSLEMIDELATWGYRPRVIVADAGYGRCPRSAPR